LGARKSTSLKLKLKLKLKLPYFHTWCGLSANLECMSEMCCIFDRKLSFLPHIRHLKGKCIKALNLLRVVVHTTWGADPQTLIHLYRSLIRSKLDYGCVVNGSARASYLRMLDPIQNHALRLCLGAYRTSPSSSLSVLANEPPLYIRRKRLSMQYCLKLSSTTQNPAYSGVFC